MNSRDLIADFDLGPGDQRAALLQVRLFILYLADHIHELELPPATHLHPGVKLLDLSDVRAALRELAEEARKIGNLPQAAKALPPAPQKRYDQADWCPDCGHIHADDSECGFPIGGGKICRCERAVVA